MVNHLLIVSIILFLICMFLMAFLIISRKVNEYKFFNKTIKTFIVGYVLIYLNIYFFIGIRSNFIVNKNIYIYNWDIIIGCILSLYIFYLALNKNSRYNEYLKKENILLYSVFGLFIFPLLTVILIQTSIIFPIHYILKKEEVTLNVKVIDKNITRDRPYQFYIKVDTNLDRFYENSRVYLKKVNYDKFKIDDNVDMIFEKTFFGYKPVRCKINE